MTQRKSLLFVIESLAGGGAEKVLSTLVKYLNKTKFKITLCCVSNVGTYLDEVKEYVEYQYILPDPSGLSGLPLFLYKIKYKLVYSWLSPKQVYRLFIPKGRDVEIAFIEGNATRILAGSSNKKAKKIAWVHTDVSINKGPCILESYYCHFDRVVAVSQTAQRAFTDLFPSVSSRVVSMYNPVDRNSILQDATQNDDVPDHNDDTLRLVSVGRLVPIKAYDRLLRVALRLHKEGFSFELWIIGEGSEWETLSQLVNKERMDDYVRLWGFVRNPYRLMSKCDLFVCSSLAEGFSTAATEAIILGLPVITTDCSGMKELLEDESCGIIVDNDDYALYRGLKMFMNDPGLLTKKKEAATRRGTTFSLDALMPPIESLFIQNND